MTLLRSRYALFCCYGFLLLAGLGYYPKWQQPATEATLSWDVSGYYMYLPAIFIYQDLKQCAFQDQILQTYHPTYEFQQAFAHPSGNYVMKYSAGQAVQYLPFFLLAHAYASVSDSYPADGFSAPYQLGITIGSFVFAFFGLFMLRKVLLLYVSDQTVAVVLLCLVFGTNYLEYAAITGAMTHNNLFAVYALLLWQTIHFYRKPSFWRGVSIGALVGLAALTRPTEILSALIPLLWGVNLSARADIRARIEFLLKHYRVYLAAGITCLAIGSIQLIYWKYVSGDWIVYSYQGEGFNWLKPFISRGLFSYRAGWLIYTPMMLFALLGFVPLFQQQRKLAYGILIFFLLFLYVAFAWEIWWYGGSLGQRTMIQIYPVLAFPFGLLVERLWQTSWQKYVVWACMLLFVYYNLWLTHQAHRGMLLHTGSMTKAYFWRILGHYQQPPHSLKLLDTKEEYRGERKNIRMLLQEDFEQDALGPAHCDLLPIQGTGSLCLSPELKVNPQFDAALQRGTADWVRATATFRISAREDEVWRMTAFMIRFFQGEKVQVDRLIRIHRLIAPYETQRLFIDVKCPPKPFDRVAAILINDHCRQPVLVDELQVEAYDEP